MKKIPQTVKKETLISRLHKVASNDHKCHQTLCLNRISDYCSCLIRVINHWTLTEQKKISPILETTSSKYCNGNTESSWNLFLRKCVLSSLGRNHTANTQENQWWPCEPWLCGGHSALHNPTAPVKTPLNCKKRGKIRGKISDLCGAAGNDGVNLLGWDAQSAGTGVAAPLCSGHRADKAPTALGRGSSTEWFSCQEQAEQGMAPYHISVFDFTSPVCGTSSPQLPLSDWTLAFFISTHTAIASKLSPALPLLSLIFLALLTSFLQSHEQPNVNLSVMVHCGSAEWQNSPLHSLISFLLLFNYQFTFLIAAVGLAETFWAPRWFPSVVILQGPPLCT